ncbi:hypothetical protein ACFSO0_01825 [Brevibacillus sp. GCM10020057]|uniref:hypothetical protein n=1 Tax=Brevibacillus sp. GCM10020057 TaxID=3317327 RepID=UPI00363A737C
MEKHVLDTKGAIFVEVPFGADEVLHRIRQIQSSGGSVSKKQVKQNDPELMRSALFYFPSWEHALKNAERI